MGLRAWDCQSLQLSISELSVVDLVVGGGWTGQTHFMVGPGRGPTKILNLMHKKNVLAGVQFKVKLPS